MKNIKKYLIIILIIISIIGLGSCKTMDNLKGYLSNRFSSPEDINKIEGEEIMLPEPQIESNNSLEKAIKNRRSVRNFKEKELTMKQISQILWAAQGITSKLTGFRAAPSAGALYPLELFIVKEDGLFHYIPEGHKLEKLDSKDLRIELMQCGLLQEFIEEAPLNIIITSVNERTTKKYGQRGIKYVYMEAGHSAQNILLQATALGLGAVTVGAFDNTCLLNLLKLPKEYTPLYIIPVGHEDI